MMTCLIALLTAVCFAWMASSAGHNWIFWALGGAVLGWATTTTVLGLVQAACIPLDSAQARAFHLRAYGGALLIIVVLGWLFTMGLHQHARSVWRHLTANTKP